MKMSAILKRQPRSDSEDPKTRKLQAIRVDNQLSDLIDAYAATSCRLLCDTMQTRLPREVCDLIFEDLFNRKIVYVDHGARCSSCVFLTREESCCVICEEKECFQEELNPNPALEIGVPHHITDAKYVGAHTLRMIAEVWYRTTEFIVSVPCMLGAPLDKDLWQTGLDVSTEARQITLSVCITGFERTGLDPPGTSTINDFLNQLEGTLRQTLQFKRGIKVKLILDVNCYMESNVNRDDLDRGLQLCFEALRSFQVHGHHLQIYLKVTRYDSLPFSVHLTSTTADDWETVLQGLVKNEDKWREEHAGDSGDNFDHVYDSDELYDWYTEEIGYDNLEDFVDPEDTDDSED